MEFDGLGILLVSLLAVWYGQLPGWYLLIGLARYFFVFGLWLRQKRHLPHHAMPPVGIGASLPDSRWVS
ncbi:MAG: hypothetical protein M5U34_17250 [Chloroflexi bacterium]|nr:hypothetical protein [Chloroflexota bacterium]